MTEETPQIADTEIAAQPSIDNDHVADGATPFTQEEIAANTNTPAASLNAAVINAEDAAIESRKPFENDLHHILHVALTELGKLEHFTFEEVKALAEKVAAKL